MLESTPDLSVSTVAEIVRLALAPVFLLSGIGAFLNVLASRLSRIVDRSRQIEPMLLASRGREHDRWIADLKVLDLRMSLINWATGFSVTSAILTCLVVILLFAANLVRTHLGTEIAWLFMASMLAIGAGFAVFLIETTVAARAVQGPFRASPAHGGRGRLGRLSAGANNLHGSFPSIMSRTTGSHVLDRVLVLEMVRVTEAAAIAASKLIGRGDEKAADAAAVEAMRSALNDLPLDGTVVIGEGERDEAPMLYIGEKVGSRPGKRPEDRHRARSARRDDDHRQGRPQRARRARHRGEAAAC